MRKVLYSVVQSAIHPNCKKIYKNLGVEHHEFSTIRKTQINIKKCPPDVLVAEFLYGYANNYSGVHISNLDVMLETLNKYAKTTRLLVFVSKQEAQYLEKLPKNAHSVYEIFELPLDINKFDNILSDILKD